MQKRVVSLLLAAVLLCSLACCAWADEEDKYQAFVDTYGPEYDSIDWEQAIADLGGLDAVDWTALFYAAGYEGAKKIKTDPVLSFVGEDAFFSDGGVWDQISAAKKKLADEYFSSASDLVKQFCTTSTMEKYSLETLDEFMDLVVNRLMPQSVRLITSRVPAFRNAPAGSLSEQIGLSIRTYKANVYAEVFRGIASDTAISLQIAVYLNDWLKKTEDGYVLKRDNDTALQLNDVIPHELMHAFMFNYNQNGMALIPPSSYSYDDMDAANDAMLYPVWFTEGAADLAAGNYQLYEPVFEWFGLWNPEGTAPSSTPDRVRQAYSKVANNLYLDKDRDTYYIGYIFGPMAVAWLCDMQWQADGHSSALSRGTDGSITAIDDTGLLNAFSRILERLHNGEPLDDIIRRITGARFLDTDDFTLRFICGGNGGSDEGTAQFCADWLNYLEALSRQKGYAVSGSLLTGLGSNLLDTLDWSKTASADLYVPVKNGYVASTTDYEITRKTAGTSHFDIDTCREGAKYVCSEGADSVYVKGSGTLLPFVFERTVSNEAAFSHFLVLETNGGILTPGSQYNAASGSVKAELLPAYLDTLAPDTYKLTAVFDDQKAVTVNFTVQAQPGSFEAVAVPSDTFTFKKVWQGDSEKSIDFTLYKADGSVYHHGFDKKIVSKTEWQYNAWFSAPAACYVIEQPLDGYITHYENVGVYAGITDRCCDGGTIINKKIPKTGDRAPLALWAGMILLGTAGIGIALMMGKRRKASK